MGLLFTRLQSLTIFQIWPDEAWFSPSLFLHLRAGRWKKKTKIQTQHWYITAKLQKRLKRIGESTSFGPTLIHFTAHRNQLDFFRCSVPTPDSLLGWKGNLGSYICTNRSSGLDFRVSGVSLSGSLAKYCTNVKVENFNIWKEGIYGRDLQEQK